MTTIAMGDSFHGRLASPSAGELAGHVCATVFKEIQRLRVRPARSSRAFDDLELLAHEQGVSISESAAFALARRFLLALPGDIPPLGIDIDNDGDIVFDWYAPGGRMVTIALSAGGRLAYAARLSATKSRNGNDYYEDGIPQEIIELVRSVAAR